MRADFAPPIHQAIILSFKQKRGFMSSTRVIVVANEKGGSGKSTVAMHIAIALIKSDQRVATIDLDARQKSLTAFVENRRAWPRQVERDLEIPDHFSFGKVHYPSAQDELPEAIPSPMPSMRWDAH